MPFRNNFKTSTVHTILFFVAALALISCQQPESPRQDDDSAKLLAKRSRIMEEWGEAPEVILNRELVSSKPNSIPCPSGWDSHCSLLWDIHADFYAGSKFRPSTDPSEIEHINSRIPRPLPCRKSKEIVSNTWPTGGLSDPVALFSEKMRRNGSSNDTWAILAIDPVTVEAAIQIAIARNERQSSEVPALRDAAVRQLFKERSKSFVLMHNGQQPSYLDEDEPQLISMRHGVGRLTGISVSLGRGLGRGKAGLLMLEDPTCEDDVSYSVELHLSSCEP